MKFISTRDKNIKKDIYECIQLGLASDGGLFVPEYFPKIDIEKFFCEQDYPLFAKKLLNEFFEGDPLFNYLDQICKNAFNFELPSKKINSNTWMLDLCKGPTLSFKDFGARFLAECLNFISSRNFLNHSNLKSSIRVATSGDTGSAVASAFYKKENIQVIILYPKGKISKKQEHQLTCWGDNILSLAVLGTFDDCQKLVKDAFKNSWWQNNTYLSSANSINIGRLLPQMTYYAYTSLQHYQKTKTAPGFIIPTGNVGNATAAFWAKKIGFPIARIVLATNENKVLENHIQTGEFKPHTSIVTLANAMDVGNPSNFERLTHLYPTFEEYKKNVSVIRVSDNKIKETIKETYKEYQNIICPHTATAFFARKQLSAEPWIVVATADACKFDDIIEPLIHAEVPLSPQMKELLTRKTMFHEIEANLEKVKEEFVKKFF